jgi:hypothetical protein
MADRTSAEIFGDLFEQLAKIDDDTARVIARWAMGRTQHYDFTTDQMGADDALLKLGLAKMGKNEYDEEAILYAGEDYPMPKAAKAAKGKKA